ncbi:hypothetical protein H1R20_g13268, partial [Candolleomyces eurysporus]
MVVSARCSLTAFEVSTLFSFKNLIPLDEISYCKASIMSKAIVWGLLAIAVLLKGLILVGTAALITAALITAALITPTNFIKTVLLQGTELNFVSEDDGCLQWLHANPIRDICDRTSYGGKQYSMCLAGRESFNVLDSGLRNIFARTNTSQETLSLHQPKGVLPQGPNGILGFDTVRASENPFASPAGYSAPTGHATPVRQAEGPMSPHSPSTEYIPVGYSAPAGRATPVGLSAPVRHPPPSSTDDLPVGYPAPAGHATTAGLSAPVRHPPPAVRTVTSFESSSTEYFPVGYSAPTGHATPVGLSTPVGHPPPSLRLQLYSIGLCLYTVVSV